MLATSLEMTTARAKQITGGLAKTSKMPCHSWGIPAKYCHTGGELSSKPNTSCSKCYAKKGFIATFAAPSYETRYEQRHHPEWVDAMVTLIGEQTPILTPFFRWFCSGDIPDMETLENIVAVAERMGFIYFWLPTQERRLINRYLEVHNGFPKNLCVRLSSSREIDLPPGPENFPQSMVVTSGSDCEAPNNDNKCGKCRRCWNPHEPMIKYLLH